LRYTQSRGARSPAGRALDFNQVVLGSSPSGLTRIIRKSGNMAARSRRRLGRQVPIFRVALPNRDRDLFRNQETAPGMAEAAVLTCFLAWPGH
jgi:hypothetical protein